jgi:hypothetical protein
MRGMAETEGAEPGVRKVRESGAEAITAAAETPQAYWHLGRP